MIAGYSTEYNGYNYLKFSNNVLTLSLPDKNHRLAQAFFTIFKACDSNQYISKTTG